MSTRLLIVDDSAMVRMLVKKALVETGFTLEEAVDGEDALEKVGKDVPSLIICDVNMPRMNGIELLERLHADPRFNRIPVLMLTTEGQPEMIQRARSLGAKGWIIKPFKPDMLVAAARKLSAAA